MSTVSVSVGLDYHQESVQVCVLDSSGKMLTNRSCLNNSKTIRAVVERCGRPVAAALEACCGAADLAHELSQLPGWSVSLAHPGYVARIKQSPDKSDYSDARLLADLVRVKYLPKVWLAPQYIRELRQMIRYRQQQVDERRNVKLRILAVLREHRIGKAPMNAWTKRWRAWLKTIELNENAHWILDRHLQRLDALTNEIKVTEQRLSGMVAKDPVIQQLRTFQGVGPITAITLRAEIGRFDRFRNGKQLARFCGLSPCNASSGNRVADAGLIKAGQPQLRATLIQAAHVLIRHDERWMQFANQMRHRGKPGSVIAAAVANRWLRWLYHQSQVKEVAA
jgi:transposase